MGNVYFIYISNPDRENYLLTFDFFLVKAKYGSDYDPDGSGSDLSTDSESAESEDEHGEELTPAVDAAILRTLARIKNKDPEIYNSQTNIFGGACVYPFLKDFLLTFAQRRVSESQHGRHPLQMAKRNRRAR